MPSGHQAHWWQSQNVTLVELTNRTMSLPLTSLLLVWALGGVDLMPIGQRGKAQQLCEVLTQLCHVECYQLGLRKGAL